MKISSGTYGHSRAASCNPGNVERRSCYPTNGTFAGASHKGHPEHSWSSGSTKTRWRGRWQGLKGSSNASSQKTVYVQRFPLSSRRPSMSHVIGEHSPLVDHPFSSGGEVERSKNAWMSCCQQPLVTMET